MYSVLPENIFYNIFIGLYVSFPLAIVQIFLSFLLVHRAFFKKLQLYWGLVSMRAFSPTQFIRVHKNHSVLRGSAMAMQRYLNRGVGGCKWNIAN
jgi:hypothetical protein